MDKSCLYSYSKKHHIENEINNSKLFYMGFELELVENSDGVSTPELEQLVKDSEDLGLIAKYDGSVDAELVSVPQLPQDLKATLCNTLSIISESSDNWVSWDQGSEYSAGGRCGFHLHVNRKSIKNVKNIYDFILNYSSYFKIFSGRKNFYYCKLDPYYMEDNYKKRCGCRYSAINNLNQHTVEFRLWRGSLFYSRLCFYVDLTVAICKYSQYLPKMTLAELLFLTDNRFLEYMFFKKYSNEFYYIIKEYKVLCRFFARKKWQKNIRNLNRFKKIKDLNGIKYNKNINARTLKQQDRITLEQLDQSDQLTVFNF